MSYAEKHVGELNYLAIIPTGNGWNVEVHRVFTRPTKYYGISESSVKRIEHIINRDDYHNFNVELGRTGWAEIQLYKDDVLRVPWTSQ